ncbi:Vacuolar ATPase assembly integral membrane protein vma21 [Erysiphe neolycopersici]|uniref:Vacuolar ATPase assembly integral membrane protein vma21 n=1 Tax=Erysiphe neolycopersici TaxID=212602 RepID=A0A420I337_9PEZI|nr:Vacuolar ATPase assembly integral membrane protein vma21 [Erysiphe neolycopersici]
MSLRNKNLISSSKKDDGIQQLSSQTKPPKVEDIKNDISNNSLRPAVPAHVIIKLLGFTFAMIIAPISCYFLTISNIFGGNSTYAGATAAIVANLVLVAYIIVAFKEDQDEASGGTQENKKQK